MPITATPMRYAHTEGHTDVCYYTGEKGGMITCGSDGDVRIWLDSVDDDPCDACTGEQNTACLSKNGKIFIANDRNTVQILSYPDCNQEGILTRFSATVSALSTAKKSSLVVSGACDMRIKVTNVDTIDSTELVGHEAPILGLSLDPQDEFVASSSADGTIRVWNIKTKKTVHTWNNIVPKCNSFETSKSFCTPSFHCVDGSSLAFPHGKEIILAERGTWKEISRLKSASLKAPINICKFSECGTKIAACSTHGEIVVWSVKTLLEVGYVEATTAKITALAWHLEKATEISFCDSKGQFGCVSISDSAENSTSELTTTSADLDIDSDDENVISLDKIKSSVELDDARSVASSAADPEVPLKFSTPAVIKLQAPFQPSSTPEHLQARFMVWNDVGIIKCYSSEVEDEAASIEVEFHDASVHHGLHIANYLNHNIAALSTEAVALSCRAHDDTPSKLVVIALQAWGSGNKEWSVDLPEGEESLAIAVGRTFVALATSRGNLRLFTVTSVQREVLALPGPVVAMNAAGSGLVVACHGAALGSSGPVMNLLWIQVRGERLRSRSLALPLTPGSELAWLGLSDAGSPTAMDSEGVVKIFDRKSGLWRIANDTDSQCKGKTDHYFLTAVSESEGCLRAILCKGAHYPATSPRPNVVEIPLEVPLCNPEMEKTRKETPLWQIGSVPSEQSAALFGLIAYCSGANLEHCVVDICRHIAPLKVIELAIKYTSKSGKMALANRLQVIAEEKNARGPELPDEIEEEEDMFAGMDDEVEMREETLLTPTIMTPTPSIEIRPLTPGVRRNPFLKKTTATVTKGLEGLNSLPEKAKAKPTVTAKKVNKPSQAKKESFISWFSRNKADLELEFPELSPSELTKAGATRFKEEDEQKLGHGDKKRKLSASEDDSQPKRAASSLTHFFSDK